MEFPVNFVLELRTQEEYDAVQDIIGFIKEQYREPMNPKIIELFDNSTIRLMDSSKESRVLINGTPVATGTTEDMTKRYKTECDMHMKSNVVLEEWANGSYSSTKSRRHQRF